MNPMKQRVESTKTPSPRTRGSSNSPITNNLDLRPGGNDRITRKLFFSIVLLVLVIAAPPLPAAVTLESFTFPTKAEEQHFKDVIGQLRCLVCQNETLADSDADLAHDLRAEVYEMMKSGKSDKEVIDFLVNRYGDFVLYNPPVKPSTYLIWYGPFVLLAIAVLLLIRAVGRQRQVEQPEISAEERKRLERLLGDNAGKGKQG
jgi:cytochrome c-type biogenesis protein CcmH